MDAGAVIAWPERHNGDELSAIQHAMNLRLQDERAFWAEYQNQPLPQEEGESDHLNADAIAAKTNGLPRGVVIPLSAGWSDVGAWDALWKVLPKCGEGNASRGDVLLENCRNTLAVSEGRLVACVGVSDLVVVETDDAILVVHHDATQDVKKVVDALKKRDHDAYKLHRTVFRPWGTYTVLEEGPRFKIKRIEVKPGASLSLQMHHHRSEHWIVVSGMAKVVNGDQELFVATNESTYIPAGHEHRLENPGILNLVMIEVQSGEYLGEDDIVRLRDKYGRCA